MDDVVEALKLATSLVGPGDGILVTGSLCTVGAVRDVLLPVLDDGNDVVVNETREPARSRRTRFQRKIDEMIDRLDQEGHRLTRVDRSVVGRSVVAVWPNVVVRSPPW